MIKKAYAVQMSYEVSVAEKEQATKSIALFKFTNKKLKKSSEHLNIMKNPLKDNPEIPPKDIMKVRAAIRRFRDESVDNFNEFKKYSFKCVQVMQTFGSDTHIIKLIKSFINSIDELEKEVNKFVDLFSDLQSKDFVKNIVSSIDVIQKQCDELSDLIEERILNYIKSNVLASTWIDSVGNELQLKIEKKKPLILELFNQRQDQINEAIKERSGNLQS